MVLFCQQQQHHHHHQRQHPSSISLISSLRASALIGFLKSREPLFRCDSGACSSFRAFLFWCREQQQQQRHQPPSISHQFLTVLVPGGAFGTLLSAAAATGAAQQRHQPPSISHQFPQVFSSSRFPDVTLGIFSVRFCGLFVLPCLAVLVPGGAF